MSEQYVFPSGQSVTPGGDVEALSLGLTKHELFTAIMLHAVVVNGHWSVDGKEAQLKRARMWADCLTAESQSNHLDSLSVDELKEVNRLTAELTELQAKYKQLDDLWTKEATANEGLAIDIWQAVGLWPGKCPPPLVAVKNLVVERDALVKLLDDERQQRDQWKGTCRQLQEEIRRLKEASGV